VWSALSRTPSRPRIDFKRSVADSASGTASGNVDRNDAAVEQRPFQPRQGHARVVERDSRVIEQVARISEVGHLAVVRKL
jgi:hypothetical protein